MSPSPLMKPARVLVVSVGVLAVGLLVVAVLALNSSVQTWAARRALAERPDLNATLGSISVGLQRVEVRALQAESDGAVLTLPSLDAELPVIAAGLQDRVAIRNLVAKGWILDLTRVEDLKTVAARWSRAREIQASKQPPRSFSLVSTGYAAEAVAAAEPLFRGVFASLQLPVDFSLDSADLEGEIILPDAEGTSVGRLQVKLTGGGLGSGREGKFVLDAAGTKPDGGSLTLRNTLSATMDTPRTFTRLATEANASASGPQFPEGVILQIDGTAVRNTAGETYGLLLAGNDRQLANIDAELVNATSQIAGTWKLDVSDVDLAPFVLGRQLPTFTATGQGGFQTGTAFKEIHASGRLAASANRLEAIRPELAAVGAVNLTADFDVLQHEDSLRVERLDATFSGTEQVARIQALQSFQFNLGTGELHVADPAQDLLGLWLTGMPVEWVRPFTGDLELTGGNLRGEFVASARDGGLTLRSKTPLTALGLNLKNAGEPWLTAIDLRLTASADYTPRGWQAQVEEITAQSQGRMLLKLNAKAGKLIGQNEGIKATGSWSADLPGWAAQPVMAGGMELSAGQAGGEFNGSLGETNAVEAKLLLSGLITPTGEALPSVESDLRAEIGSDARTTFNAATLFNLSGRRSDLLITGTLSSAAEITTVDARVSSDRVVLEDVKLLGGLIPGGQLDSRPPEEPDSLPFWHGLRGQATLALKSVQYGDGYEISDVVGVIKIEPDGLKLQGVHAVFGPESDLKLNGEVTFDPNLKESYALSGDVALNNFDTTQAFRAVDPARLPTVETRMNLTGNVSGNGENLATLVERAQGKFELTSKGGIFRALATVLPEQKLQATQSALSVVGGLFGGTSSGEMITTANEIVKLVSEIQFDQLSVTASRDENLNFVLKDFNLIAPYVRLGGEGLINYTPGKSLLQQALDLRITLGARGRLGELLSQWKLLKAEKDNLGYTAFVTPIKLSGTLLNTDSRDFQNKLLEVALGKSGVGDAINRLLGGGKQPEN